MLGKAPKRYAMGQHWLERNFLRDFVSVGAAFIVDGLPSFVCRGESVGQELPGRESISQREIDRTMFPLG